MNEALPKTLTAAADISTKVAVLIEDLVVQLSNLRGHLTTAAPLLSAVHTELRTVPVTADTVTPGTQGPLASHPGAPESTPPAVHEPAERFTPPTHPAPKDTPVKEAPTPTKSAPPEKNEKNDKKN